MHARTCARARPRRHTAIPSSPACLLTAPRCPWQPPHLHHLSIFTSSRPKFKASSLSSPFLLFFPQLQCTFNIICISFRCTAQWLDNPVLYRVVPPGIPIATGKSSPNTGSKLGQYFERRLADTSGTEGKPKTQGKKIPKPKCWEIKHTQT